MGKESKGVTMVECFDYHSGDPKTVTNYVNFIIKVIVFLRKTKEKISVWVKATQEWLRNSGPLMIKQEVNILKQ